MISVSPSMPHSAAEVMAAWIYDRLRATLPELADVCNKVGIIDKGELKQNATKAEVIRMVY